MISYDSYVKKIKKVKSLKNTIYRFRVLIITVLSVITFSSTGFLVSKGLITQNVELPNTIVYGETYGIKEAKALFSKITYEFSEKGEDNWSKEKPTLPGDYSVRAVTEKNFNATGYGKVVDFTILPKPVDLTVSSTNIIYGDDPVINTDFLVKGDTLEKVSFEYEDILAATTKVNADKDSIIIRNSEGQDVTGFYNFKEIKSDITVEPKELFVKPVIEGKTYDGLSVDYNNELTDMTVEGLVEGDEISFKTIVRDINGNVLDSMPKDAGTYFLYVDTASLEIYNSKLNAEITAKYNISYAATEFTIKPREITLYPEDFEDKAYDGVEYKYKDEFNNFTYSALTSEENKLVDGESIKVKVGISSTRGYSNMLNADNYSLSIEEVIAGPNTKLENYIITKRKTNVAISRRKVTLYPKDFEDKIYDGIEYVYVDEINNFVYKEGTKDENKLVEGEELKINIAINSIRNNFNILSADTYVLSITSVEASQNLDLNNYTITYGTQEVVISRRPVEISLLDINEENKNIYDGNYIDYDETRHEITSELGFVGEDSIGFDVLFDNMHYSVKDAKKYNVNIANHYFINGDENNYELIFKGIEYEIEPRPISIEISEFAELSKVYDGVYESHDNTWTYASDSLQMIDGEELYINVVFENDTIEYFSVKDAANYKVKVKDYIVLNGSNSNYAFSASEFEYLIEKREVTIRPYNFDYQDGYQTVTDSIENSEIYNGHTYRYDNNSYNNFVVSSGEIVMGEAFNALVEVEEGDVKDVGTYTLKIVEDRFDPNYDTNLNNYIINVEDVDVKFTIEKREITIAPTTDYLTYETGEFIYYVNQKEYDNNAYIYYDEFMNFVTTGEYGVADNDYFKVRVKITLDGVEVDNINDVGTYVIEIPSTLDIIPAEGTNLDNYIINIDENEVNYTVTKRHIKVKIIESGLDKTYDGKELTYSDQVNNFYTTDETSIAFGDELFMNLIMTNENDEVVDFAHDAGVYTLTYKDIVGLNDTKVSNYEIEVVEESISFEIYRKEVSVIFESLNEGNTHVYDGSYIEAKDVVYSTIGMIHGETLVVNTSIGGEEKVKDAGEYYVGITNENGNTTKEVDDYEVENGNRHNYYISHAGYYYVINKKDITIRPYTFDDELGLVEEVVNSDVYNGKTYEYKEEYNNFVLVEGNIVENEGIMASIEILDRNYEAVDEVRNANEYHIRIKEDGFVAKENTNLDNYNITLENVNVMFNILQRQVYVDLFNIEIDGNPTIFKVYDGKEVTFNEKENEGWAIGETSPYGMVEGEILTIDVKFDGLDSIKDVKVDYSTGEMQEAPYTVYVESYFVENGLLDNYIFSARSFEFTIEQRELFVTALNFDYEEGFVSEVTNSEVYNGFTYEYLNDYENFVIKAGTIVEGEHIKATASIKCDNDLVNTYGVKNVGNYTIDLLKDGFEFLNTLPTNYKITVSSVVLFEITTRKVTLAIDDLQFVESGTVNNKIYDGYETYHSNTYQDLGIEYPLLDEEPLTVMVGFENIETKEYSYSVKNAGEYIATIKDYDMFLPDGCFLSNYEFDIKEVAISISKRQVSIMLDRMEGGMYDGEYRSYNGESYTVTSDLGIADGESIWLDVRFNGLEKVKDAGDYTVKISSLLGNEEDVEDGITVYNGLRANYIFEVDEYSISISKRPISIRPYNYDYYEELNTYVFGYEKEHAEIYNGITYVYPVDKTNNFVYEDGSLELAAEEFFKVEIEVSSLNGNVDIKNVDEYTFTIGNIVETINFNINNYDISFGETKFTINKRPITITTSNINETNSKIYDAEEVTYEIKVGNFDILSGSLVENEDFIIQALLGKEEAIVDANPNPYPVTIEKVNGTSRTDVNNYDIDYSDVKYFTIDPRPISIIASNEFIIDQDTGKSINKDEVEYNGHYYQYSSSPNNFGYLEESLKVVGDDKFEIIVKVNDIIENRYKNADDYEHVIDKVIALGETKATNYVIDYSSIYTFVVAPRTITIRPFTFDYELGTSKAYANEEDYNGYTYIYDNESWNNFVTGAQGVVEGENINVKVIVNEDPNTIVKNVGTYKLSIIEGQYTYGPNTLESNYAPVLNDKPVTFVIKKRKVAVELEPLKNKTYDGITVGYDEQVFTYYESSMVEGESLEIEVQFYEINKELYYEEVVDAGEYDVLITSYNVVNGLNGNYEFSQNNTQRYTISKRKVVITPDYKESKVYDGEYATYSEFEKNNFKVVEGSLVENETIGVVVKFLDSKNEEHTQVKDVDKYRIVIKDHVGYDEFNNENYIIEYREKGFEITVRSIELTLNKQIYGNDGLYEYDGTYFEADPSYKVTSGSICKDDVIELSIQFAKEGMDPTHVIKDVGEYSLVFSDYLVNSDRDQNRNYSIKVIGVDKTVLVIEKRVVRVKLNNINEENQKTYDKLYIDFDETSYVLTQGTMVPGEGLRFEVKFRKLETEELTNAIIDTGIYEVIIPDFEVINNGDLANYDIKQVDIYTFEIKKRDVYLTLADTFQDKVYDGIYYESTGNYYYTYMDRPETWLASGDSFNPFKVEFENLQTKEISTRVVNVGDYKVIRTPSQNDEELLKNYNIIFSNANEDELSNEFTISTRVININVTTEFISDYYGDVRYYYEDIMYETEDKDDQFFNTHTFKLRVMFNGVQNEDAIDAGLYVVTLDEENTVLYRKEDYLDSKGNCIINIIGLDKEFEIYRRPMSINIENPQGYEDLIYDGKDHKIQITFNNMAYFEERGVKINTQLYYASYIFDVDMDINVYLGEKPTDGVIISTMVDAAVNAGTYYVGLGNIEWGIINPDNYEFNPNDDIYNNVHFMIKPRPITISPSTSAGFEYGNSTYKARGITSVSGGVPNNEGFEIETVLIDENGFQIDEAVESGIYYERIISLEANYRTNINNYEISTEDSSFVISKRRMAIETIIDFKEYDGKPFEYNYYQTPNYQVSDLYEYRNYAKETAYGEVIMISGVGYYDEEGNYTYFPTEIGRYRTVIDGMIMVSDSSQKRIDNYDFTFVESYIEITRKIISISLEDSETYHYDRTSREITNGYSYAPLEDGKTYKLPEGYTLNLNSFFVNNETGEISYKVEEVSFNRIDFSNYQVFDEEGNDVTDSFEVRLGVGCSDQLNIWPRRMHIKPVYAEKIYDGTELKAPEDMIEPVDFTTPLEYKVGDIMVWMYQDYGYDGLLPGHYIRVETSEVLVKASQSKTNEITYYEIYDDEGNIIQSSDTPNVYYDVIYNADMLNMPEDLMKKSFVNKITKLYQQTIKINKRVVRVTPYDVSQTYGDEITPDFVVNYHESKDEGLIPGHRIESYILNSATKVPGVYDETTVKYNIYDENNYKVTSNYTVVNTQSINFVVAPKVITITVGSASAQYDPANNQGLSCNEFTISEEDQAFLKARKLLIDCIITGFIQTPGVAVNTIKNPSEDVTIYKIMSASLGTTKEFTHCFEFIVIDGQLVMYA